MKQGSSLSALSRARQRRNLRQARQAGQASSAGQANLLVGQIGGRSWTRRAACLRCLANALGGLRTSAAAAKSCRIADPGRVGTRSSATGLPLRGQAGQAGHCFPSHRISAKTSQLVLTSTTGE